MNLATYSPPENHPALVEATRKALRFYPGLCTDEHPLEVVAEAISRTLSMGDPGMVVFSWGRALAADIFANIKGMDDDERVVKLYAAIGACASIRDNEGQQDSIDFYTAEMPPVAPEPEHSPPPTPDELHLRELLQNVYMQHGYELPEGIFGPTYEGWEHRFSQPIKFDAEASCLSLGMGGWTVMAFGREYSKHILAAMEQAGFFELCSPLRAAIKSGVSPFDALGYLPPDAPQLNKWLNSAT
ncbi:hypothetical protein [Hymenobacter convexus]|uniref:hypothetical protein n=1 Tax=Hymenobacter sp. CA1UV-4 TaxID=3063782 RepID=UPI0027123645|nr:hypothetical protein [Hymenobacter sp. CA1UV-4]MDO7852963.1 hypothetical protein [Hymenobacter sp. CA1UV-4]